MMAFLMARKPSCTTNPLVAEFDGSVSVVDSALGYAAVSTGGDWKKFGTALLSRTATGMG